MVFAARRLAGHDVLFLVARRAGRASELERALEPAGVARVELGPLSFGAISGVLAARLAGPLPRRVARQVFEVSGGNPLFAVELGRAVLERGLPEIGAGLPVPEVLGELFGARVGALAPPVRRALLAVALAGGLTAGELAAVADPLAVADAQAAGVLAADGARVRAVHPLLAAAAARRRPSGATCTPRSVRRWAPRCCGPGTGRWPCPGPMPGWQARWRRRPGPRRRGRRRMPPSWPGMRCG